jgi:hypothetical protein
MGTGLAGKNAGYRRDRAKPTRMMSADKKRAAIRA